MHKASFYAALRRSGSGLFGTLLSQRQVDGLETLLDEALRRRTPLNDLAYILATTYHETARTMQPIYERGSRAYFDKYEPGTRLGHVLGNTVRGDGFAFRGRGYVQLTGRSNYERAGAKLGIDLVGKPDLALQPKHAARILFEGMREGWFTGQDLDAYIDQLDEADAEDLREYRNARRIINGTDKADQIAGHALAFEKALRTAGYSEAPIPPRKPAGAQKPVRAPSPVPTLKPQPAKAGGWIPAVFAAIVAAAVAAIAILKD
jgi:putative chitinase